MTDLGNYGPPGTISKSIQELLLQCEASNILSDRKVIPTAPQQSPKAKKPRVESIQGRNVVNLQIPKVIPIVDPNKKVPLIIQGKTYYTSWVKSSKDSLIQVLLNGEGQRVSSAELLELKDLKTQNANNSSQLYVLPSQNNTNQGKETTLNTLNSVSDISGPVADQSEINITRQGSEGVVQNQSRLTDNNFNNLTSVATSITIMGDSRKGNNESTKANETRKGKDKEKHTIISLHAEMTKNHEQLSQDMKKGFEDISKSMLDPDLGVVPRLNRIEKQITDPENGLVVKMQMVEKRMDEVEATQMDNNAIYENAELWSTRINEVVDYIERQETEMAALRNEVNSLKAKSMEQELLVGGIAESFKENLKIKITHFLRGKVKITFENKEVITVKRVGGRRMVDIGGNMVKTPKLVLMRCTQYLKNKIMKNVYNLRGETDPDKGYKYFVSTHIPDAFREARSKYKKQVDDIKEQNKSKAPKEKIPVRITSGKLYVNNEVIEDEVYPPKAREILRMTPSIIAQLDAVQLYETKTIEDKKNEFKAYSTIAGSPEEIQLAYLRVRQMNVAATHVTVGYTYKTTEGEHKYGGCDDNEHGGAARIIRAIKRSKYTNIAIFVVRYYSGIHLGTDRFKHIDSLADQGIKLIDDTQSQSGDDESEAEMSETGVPKPQRIKKKRKKRTRNKNTGKENVHPVPESQEDDDDRFTSLPEDN